MAIRSDNIIEEKIYCDKFDTQTVSNLSLFLFEDHYFYFAKDQNKKVLCIQSQEYESPRLLTFKLKEEKLLNLDVPIQVYNHVSSFSLVPGPLFDQALSSVFLFFADKPSENSKVIDTSLESNNLHLVGSIRKDLAEQLSENKSEISFHHGASSFLSYVLKEKFNLLSQEILILVQRNYFYLAAFSNQEIMLFNRFDLGNKEDILKYIMGISSQLEFNRNYFRLTIFGDPEFHQIDKAWISQYFKNINITSPIPNVQYHDGAEKFQKPAVFESYWELP
ncbi:DUF3822 family protein [Aquiflexum lacus]|uniref:DUF3822 family protein n=1 Tax=Aquiflexum lacus TaxID=2483805 RepID=UPI001895BA45|nr:DUF3822 family protein [Aquiflexum lacus]